MRIMLAVVTFAIFSVLQPTNADSEPGWQVLLGEFTEPGFDSAFVESLAQAHGVCLVGGLRTVVPPVRLRKETLIFKVGWGFVKAGYAEISFSTDSARGIAQSSFKGVTNRFVSAFYRVQDLIRSTMDITGLYPLFFEEHVNEGRYSARRWILFDHQANKAYTNHRKESKREKDIAPFEYDLLSMIQAVRMMPLEPGTSMNVHCFVQGKSYPVEFDVTKREKVTVEAGTFECVVVEPKLSDKGRNFSKRDKIQVWFTNDACHMPVMIKSKIAIGSVVGELISYSVDTPAATVH